MRQDFSYINNEADIRSIEQQCPAEIEVWLWTSTRSSGGHLPVNEKSLLAVRLDGAWIEVRPRSWVEAVVQLGDDNLKETWVSFRDVPGAYYVVRPEDITGWKFASA